MIVPECLRSKLPPVPPDATKGYTGVWDISFCFSSSLFLTFLLIVGSSPPSKWLMPHGRGRYPCKNGRGHYEFREHMLYSWLLIAFSFMEQIVFFRCLGNTEFTSLGSGCTAEPPRGIGKTHDGKGGATGTNNKLINVLFGSVVL